MRLKDYAKKIGISYITAYTYWRKGLIKGIQLPTGAIFVDEVKTGIPTNNNSNTETKENIKAELEHQEDSEIDQTDEPLIKENKRVVLYARVSSSENKNNLDTQLERLREFANSKNYKIVKEVKEIGSGINDKRKKLLKLLKNTKIQYDIILVEHKDRFARFGIAIIEELLDQLGKKLEIINQTEVGKERITQDLIDIITSFSAKIYGLRRSKRETLSIINKLKNTENTEENNTTDTENDNQETKEN